MCYRIVLRKKKRIGELSSLHLLAALGSFFLNRQLTACTPLTAPLFPSHATLSFSRFRTMLKKSALSNKELIQGPSNEFFCSSGYVSPTMNFEPLKHKLDICPSSNTTSTSIVYRNQMTECKPTMPRPLSNSSQVLPWMSDERFTKSKIFQAQMYKAAVNVQKNVRRFLLRDCLENEKKSIASTKIQSCFRGSLQRTILKGYVAARCIQMRWRGWRTRMSHEVSLLQQRLDHIEVQRVQELQEIRTWERHQKGHLERRRERSLKKEREKDAELEHIVVQADDLKVEHKQLCLENEQLSQRCNELCYEKEKMERNLQNTNVRIDELKSVVADVEEQIQRSKAVMHVLGKMKEKYDSGVEKHNARVDIEGKLSHIHLRAVAKIVSHVQASSCEQDVCQHIMNLAMLGVYG